MTVLEMLCSPFCCTVLGVTCCCLLEVRMEQNGCWVSVADCEAKQNWAMKASADFG